jgi:hypothetical protein
VKDLTVAQWSSDLRRSVRLAFILLGIAIAAVPIAFIATFVLYPFWSWIEATTGIESVGHSGPADWCFIFMYALLAVGAAIPVIRAAYRAEQKGNPARGKR